MSSKSTPTIESIMKVLNEIAASQKESDRQRIENQKKLEKLERRRAEDQKRLERQRAEDQKRFERQRAEDQKKLERQKIEDQKKLEQQRIEDQKELEQQRTEDQKRFEEKLEQRRLEDQKRFEEKLEQQRVEDQKRFEEKLEQQRVEDQKRLEQQRIEDQKKLEKQKADREMADQEIRDRFKRLAEFQEASSRGIDKEFRKVSRQLGKWGNELGSLVENAVYGNLQDILNDRGMNITKVIRNVSSKSYDGSEEDWEFDFIGLSSLKAIVVVEAKSTLGIKDVKRFLHGLRNITRWFPYYKGLKVYGCVAYLKDYKGASLFAQENGLFVIHAVGDSAKVTNPIEWTPTDIPQN